MIQTSSEIIDIMVESSQDPFSLNESHSSLLNQRLQEKSLPQNPTSLENILKELSELAHQTSSFFKFKNKNHSPIPFVSISSSVVYAAMNPNHVTWEVSNATTLVENRLVEWFTQIVSFSDLKKSKKRALLFKTWRHHDKWKSLISYDGTFLWQKMF